MRTFQSALIKSVGIFCALALPSLAHAQITVAEATSFNASSSLYTYAYTVTNNTATDLALLDIPVIADPATVQSLTAAPGYQAVFDSGLGIVSFLPNLGVTGFDPGTTVSGFAIVSPFKPNNTQFSGLDSLANFFAGGTVGPSSVPEPGVAALSLTTLATGLGLGLRARRHATRKTA